MDVGLSGRCLAFANRLCLLWQGCDNGVGGCGASGAKCPFLGSGRRIGCGILSGAAQMGRDFLGVAGIGRRSRTTDMVLRNGRFNLLVGPEEREGRSSSAEQDEKDQRYHWPVAIRPNPHAMQPSASSLHGMPNIARRCGFRIVQYAPEQVIDGMSFPHVHVVH